MALDKASRIMSGTFGEAWIDGEQLAECYGLQAKMNANKEKVAQCGTMVQDHKIKSVEGRGSIRLYKASSRMIKLVGEKMKKGQDVRCTIISKLADPDAWGAERVVLKNVSFDDITLADSEADTFGKTEHPFTFTDYELLDAVDPQ